MLQETTVQGTAQTIAGTSLPAKRLTIGLFGYSPDQLQQVFSLAKSADLESLFSIVTPASATAQDGPCDMALVVLDNESHLTRFKNDITHLKASREISIVMALVDQKAREIIERDKSQIAADDIFFMPMEPDEFAKIIVTHTAAIRIGREREQNPSDHGHNSHSLGQILLHDRVIDTFQLKKALEYQKRSGGRLGDTLVELGYIDQEQKMHFLSGQLGVPIATPRQYASADLNIIALIPEHIARRYTCLALERNGNELSVVMLDVTDLRLLDSLRDATDLTIRPILGEQEDILTSIDRFYRDITSHRDASNLMANLGEQVEFVQAKHEETDISEIAAAGAELGIVKLVNMLIANAVRDRASDIHIEPMEQELTVRYRIDGDLRKIMSPPQHSHQAIITRIKILSNLDIAERRLPQDGRMVVKTGSREVDVRVSILPTVFGEKAVLRILDKDAFEKSVANLGFSPYDMNIFKSQIVKPYGMIIVTGPTGSGKSTTLYSALQQVKNVTRNIVTVEDPVEFHIEGVTQVHVNTKIGLTFASSLRSILRQDPDIVLIGEIRDEETADIAIKMSMTGHLVFSTLHTNDAAGAIARFVDIGLPPLLLGSSLNLIVAQRLVRRICTRCKVDYEAPAELLEQLNMAPSGTTRFFRGEGCVSCNGTGYLGRTGIFELLVVTKEIRKLILRNASTMEIQEQAEKEGMKTLRRSGIELALRGETTIEQVIAVTTEI